MSSASAHFEPRADKVPNARLDLAASSRAWRWARLSTPAGLDSLAVIADYVRSVCDRGEVGEGAGLRLRLAVEELSANAIVHGYGERDRARGRLTLAGGGYGQGSVSVQLCDSAAPFDPRSLSRNLRLDLPVKDRPVGGLGIHLALTSADEYRYEYVNSQNRSTLTVWRRAGEH